jgi:Uncharacterized conserved protein
MVVEIEQIDRDFSVCKVADYSYADLNTAFCFVGKTDEEKSLVCLTGDVPPNATDREDGWKAFRIRGILDFSLIGILSGISGILAENAIGIFVVSTYNTDYVFTKKEDYARAIEVLGSAGYKIVV